MKSLTAPGKYYQGRHILRNLSKYIKPFGTDFTVMLGPSTKDFMEPIIQTALEGTCRVRFACFGGESTAEEAQRIGKLVQEHKSHGLIGAGGGKVLDTAKKAADMQQCPLILIPTSAASDAPCSAMSVVYDEEGRFAAAEKMKRNPDVVLVDTQIILEASEKSLAAGIGDAFATYYEARACRASGTTNSEDNMGTETAFALTKLCKELLLQYGEDAWNAVRKKQYCEALENCVEANIYLSGVGFENNGCAISHGVYNGMSAVLVPFPVSHGVGVAYGTLVQLQAEKASKEEWQEAVNFYKKVKLPLCLEDLGIDAKDETLLKEISQAVCEASPLVKHMPFKVTPDLILEAMVNVEKEHDQE
ncbi:glycerol dehydrogenase [Ihubacter massiliensis]|uniref:Glycerol dehydrogenase n=1 Tax=Hominibacterium faecale TaxID=2839743 RepID=A0A9J6QID6_9FIRM|nr:MULTISPECIES: glycerol dehydrogenase [Eubacteriales Family XIII. Incertae Sedis]MCO7123004.1 glycerol dehydrogenase [Ihubacter massiliensis]MCU7377264.1 glycerol dehydrogenase [Hominibacterium faecale]